MNQVVMREQEGRGAHQGPGFRTLEPGAKKPGEAWIPDPGSKIQRKPSLPSLSSIPSLLSPPSLPILTSYRPLEDQQEEENHIRLSSPRLRPLQHSLSLSSLSSKQMTRDSSISSKNNNSSPRQLSSKQQLTSNLSLLPSLFNISSGTSPSSLTLPSNKQLAREKQYVSSGNKQVSLSSLLSIK